MSAQLLILAAGIGRRFGGLKQIQPLGPGGAALMDYTVYDSLNSGFERIVLVIRPEIEDAVRAHVDAGFGSHVHVDYVLQKLDSVPTQFAPSCSRSKPWGTGHAVLSARTVIDGPFAVANADDFYGAPAINALGRFLDSACSQSSWAVVGFPIVDTLPFEGSVTRALLEVDDGWLRAINEIPSVRRHSEGACYETDGGPHVVHSKTPVSMNLWGFGSDVIARLQDGFHTYLRAVPTEDDEYILPTAIGEFLNNEVVQIQVISTRSRWCGVTSVADGVVVERILAEMVNKGLYPERLWD